MQGITYNVRIYKTKVYNGKKVTTHYARWMVDGREWKEPFRNAAQADSFRSSLLTAAAKARHSALAPAALRPESEPSLSALRHYARMSGQ